MHLFDFCIKCNCHLRQKNSIYIPHVHSIAHCVVHYSQREPVYSLYLFGIMYKWRIYMLMMMVTHWDNNTVEETCLTHSSFQNRIWNTFNTQKLLKKQRNSYLLERYLRVKNTNDKINAWLLKCFKMVSWCERESRTLSIFYYLCDHVVY